MGLLPVPPSVPKDHIFASQCPLMRKLYSLAYMYFTGLCCTQVAIMAGQVSSREATAAVRTGEHMLT